MTSTSRPPGAALRVVIADDHPIWRSGIRADLGDGFDVVGEAGDATEAIDVVRATSPDLVLCDLQMPGGGGLAVTSAVATLAPVVILTVSTDADDLLEVVAAGAVGYLLKSTRPEQLRADLAAAAAGAPVFSPGLAALLVGEFRRLSSDSGARMSPLTAREREVLSAVARGGSYRSVADQLFISPRTVENHVRNIMAKLHLSHRHELVRWAVDHGIE